jgi:hypothetical protein
MAVKGFTFLWKTATGTPKARRISIISLGVILFSICIVSTTSIIENSIWGLPTPIDQNAIFTSAVKTAWAPYTQTAVYINAISTAWESYTQTAFVLLPTQTNTPAFTATIPPPTVTNTPSPTLTFTLQPTTVYIPPVPTYPIGATAICKDGTYSYSQTASGTCSGHGGVSTWIRHP